MTKETTKHRIRVEVLSSWSQLLPLPPFVLQNSQGRQQITAPRVRSLRGAQAKIAPRNRIYLPHQRIVPVGLDFTGVDHFTLKGPKPDSFGNEATAEYTKMWDFTKQHPPEAET